MCNVGLVEDCKVIGISFHRRKQLQASEPGSGADAATQQHSSASGGPVDPVMAVWANSADQNPSAAPSRATTATGVEDGTSEDSDSESEYTGPQVEPLLSPVLRHWCSSFTCEASMSSCIALRTWLLLCRGGISCAWCSRGCLKRTSGSAQPALSSTILWTAALANGSYQSRHLRDYLRHSVWVVSTDCMLTNLQSQGWVANSWPDEGMELHHLQVSLIYVYTAARLRYEAALARRWRKGDKIEMFWADAGAGGRGQLWEGTFVGMVKRSPDDPARNSPWAAITVRWTETGGTDNVSMWEISSPQGMYR